MIIQTFLIGKLFDAYKFPECKVTYFIFYVYASLCNFNTIAMHLTCFCYIAPSFQLLA